jgi:hypothetical protein
VNATEVKVRWSDATLESGAGNRFRVTAPITAEHGERWGLAFRAVLHERADEVTDGPWSTIGLLDHTVVVGGVTREAMEAVQAFVDDCVRRANLAEALRER